jgi:hypothetical protein
LISTIFLATSVTKKLDHNIPSAGTADEGTGSCPVKNGVAERSGAGADKERVSRRGLEAERAEILARQKRSGRGKQSGRAAAEELQDFRQIINVILDFDPEKRGADRLFGKCRSTA